MWSMPVAETTWNSLEVTKLAVGALTPIIVVVIGVRLQRSLKAIEAAQWINQRVIEWKIKAYDDLCPAINDIYCFFYYVGSFKDHEPPAIILLKRELDKKVEIARPLLGPGVVDAYESFLGLCFKTYSGLNHDAQMRTGFASRREAWGVGWRQEWEGLFVAEEAEKEDRAKIHAAYRALMEMLAAQLDLEWNRNDPERHSVGRPA